jgi:hypothetical protein
MGEFKPTLLGQQVAHSRTRPRRCLAKRNGAKGSRGRPAGWPVSLRRALTCPFSPAGVCALEEPPLRLRRALLSPQPVRSRAPHGGKSWSPRPGPTFPAQQQCRSPALSPPLAARERERVLLGGRRCGHHPPPRSLGRCGPGSRPRHHRNRIGWGSASSLPCWSPCPSSEGGGCWY